MVWEKQKRMSYLKVITKLNIAYLIELKKQIDYMTFTYKHEHVIEIEGNNIT